MTDLHPDVVRAISQLAHTKLGRRYDRFARKRYGVSGPILLGKTNAAEFGGRSTATGRGVVSSAGARGPFQFISSTRTNYKQRYGVDAWAGDRQAAKAAMLHHLNTGVEGYNPGMPTYKDLVLGQKLDPADRRALKRASGGGGGSTRGPSGSLTLAGPQHTDVALAARAIPGQSFAEDRQSARRELLLGGKLTMDRLLEYKQTVGALKDVPGRQVAGDIRVRRSQGPGVQVDTQGAPGQPAAGPPGAMPNTGRSLNRMLDIARRVDKLNNGGKVPYLWGGGHGASPAKPGEAVDCSGFVSQVLGIEPRVSGSFAASWGKPGGGKWVTVYANDGHVLMKMRDPDTGRSHWFGTSGSNPGGGPGEIAAPSKEYLASFTKRHPGGRK